MYAISYVCERNRYMSENCIRKFSPNKKHIISAVLLATALVLFVIGAFRAAKVSDPRSIKQGDSVSTGECITISNPEILYGSMTGANRSRPIEWAEQNGKHCYIIPIGGELCPLIVDDKEFQRWIDTDRADSACEGFEMTAIVTDKYSDGFLDYMKNIDRYYSKFYHNANVDVAYDNCTVIGLKAVSPARERQSFLLGLPFFIAGNLILAFAGKPFVYIPYSENI